MQIASMTKFSGIIVPKKLPNARLKIKNILRSPFGNQLEKYSRQMQIFSHRFV